MKQIVAFQAARLTSGYQAAFKERRPLVSVCIATYNRSQLLTERAVASILAQTYQHFELIVIGDQCTDDTAEKMAHIRDPRVTFINLAERGIYPSDARHRWMVAGTKPMNYALSLTNGRWITHLDDDDEYHPERLERLIDFAQSESADLVWHPFYSELENGWTLMQATIMRYGQVTTSSSIYHSWFKRVHWDLEAWRDDEPGDWHRFRRIKYHYPRMRRFAEPLLRHYRERNQRSPDRREAR